jgi:hypothetical protein
MKKEETKPRNRRNLSKTLKRIEKNSEILRNYTKKEPEF